jgi:hypothetical protein
MQLQRRSFAGNTALPAFVRDNILLSWSNGLRAAGDGVTNLSSGELALYSLLTAQVPLFIITSDTGDVPSERRLSLRAFGDPSVRCRTEWRLW